MTTPHCPVCGVELEGHLYASPGSVSVTSLCQLVDAPTIVHLCERCGHLFTDGVLDAASFYADQYTIFLEHAEEDNLYDIVDDLPVYRTDHQVSTLMRKLDIAHGARVLDYGCAKGLFMRKLASHRPDLDIALFDVSDMYRSWWEEFLPSDRWATFAVPDSWLGSMDVVISSYSMEHMPDPNAAVSTIASLLRPGGVFYGLVPDTVANPADLIVVDHLNHFTVASLTTLLQRNGFEVNEIDRSCHDSALVFSARRGGPTSVASTAPALDIVSQAITDAHRLAEHWSGFQSRVRSLAQSAGETPQAIYGAGFYGTVVAAALDTMEHVRCFVDRDVYRHGKQLFDRPILPPESLPPEVDVVLVGLNPNTARRSLDAVTAWEHRRLEILFP